MLFKYNLKYCLKSLFIILFFCFLQVNVFSETGEALSYCYNPKDGSIGTYVTDDCTEDGYIILKNDQSPQQVLCELDPNEKYSKVGDLDTIYNDSQLKNEGGVLIDQYALFGVDFHIVSQIGCKLVEKTGGGGDATLDLDTIRMIVNGDTGIPPSSNPELGTEEGSENTSTDINPYSCHNRIGPFKLFSSKSYCEADTDCLFNPYGINILKENAEVSINRATCINKTYIRKCSHYKTEGNCVDNLVDFGSQCEWVESQDYSLGLFNFKTGICIERDRYDSSIKKDLERNNMNDRGNLIKNPSFEDLNSIYLNSISNDSVAYDLNNYYVFSDTNLKTFETNVTSLKGNDDKTYGFRFYVKGEKPFNITYDMIFYDAENISLGSIKDDHAFIGTGIFERYSTSTNIVFPENLSRIHISMKSNESGIFLDNLILKETYNDLEFFEVIPKVSSNCDKCFVGGFNLCTENKSNLLGDCSYMVEGVDHSYTLPNSFLASTEERNPHLLNEWNSQSFFNIDLRCEYYKNLDTCLDPNNYLNSKFGKYHKFGKVCSWDENYGCFKDSNNDSLPDRVNKTYFGEKGFNEYLDEDFKFSCDVIPPRSYIYFKGKNLSGEEVFFDNLSNVENEYGDIYVHFDVEDSFSPLCGNFIEDKKTFYFENGDLAGKEETRLYTPKKLKNLLVNDGGESRLSFQFFDNSGNIEKEKSFFDFDIDLEGPIISWTNIVEESENYPGKLFIYEKNYTFNFSIEDRNDLKNCTYSIYNSSNNILNIDIYEEDGDVRKLEIFKKYEDNETVSNETEFSLTSHIIDSYPRTDSYTLAVYCYDIFGQAGAYRQELVFDLNPDLQIIKPDLEFEGENDTFFIGNDSHLFLQSGNPYINSCRAHFDGIIQGSYDVADYLNTEVDSIDLNFNRSIENLNYSKITLNNLISKLEGVISQEKLDKKKEKVNLNLTSTIDKLKIFNQSFIDLNNTYSSQIGDYNFVLNSPFEEPSIILSELSTVNETVSNLINDINLMNSLVLNKDKIKENGRRLEFINDSLTSMKSSLLEILTEINLNDFSSNINEAITDLNSLKLDLDDTLSYEGEITTYKSNLSNNLTEVYDDIRVIKLNVSDLEDNLDNNYEVLKLNYTIIIDSLDTVLENLTDINTSISLLGTGEDLEIQVGSISENLTLEIDKLNNLREDFNLIKTNIDSHIIKGGGLIDKILIIINELPLSEQKIEDIIFLINTSISNKDLFIFTENVSNNLKQAQINLKSANSTSILLRDQFSMIEPYLSQRYNDLILNITRNYQETKIINSSIVLLTNETEDLINVLKSENNNISSIINNIYTLTENNYIEEGLIISLEDVIQMVITNVSEQNIVHPDYSSHFIETNISNIILLNILDEGTYEGKVTCYEPYEVYKNISLIKHTSVPEITIHNLYKDDNSTYYIDENNLVYLDYSGDDERESHWLNINFSFIGEKLEEEYNISKYLDTSEKIKDNIKNPLAKSIFQAGEGTSYGTKYVGNKIINNTGEMKLENRNLVHNTAYEQIDGGALIKEGFNKGLYNMTFNITYFDKVYNNDSFIVSYLKDPEHYVTLNLSGFFTFDIDEEPSSDSSRDSEFNLYTSSINPEINLNFSSPLYKTYNCNLSYDDKNEDEYVIVDFLNKSNKNISFDILSNISENISLYNEDDSNDEFILSCKDNIYNIDSEHTFIIHYNNFSLDFQTPHPIWPRHKDNSLLIGKNSKIMIYSSQSDIDNCNIYLNTSLSASLNSTSIEVEKDSSVTYTRNITNSTFLDSLGQGSYVGNVTCITPYEIFKYVNITKVTSIPELNILDRYKEDNKTYHIDDNGVFYADYDDDDILINVSAPDYDLYNVLEDEEDVYVEVFNGTNFTNVSAPSIKFTNINETTYDNATLQIGQGGSSYQGVLIESGFNKGLFNYTFNITYTDEVNNTNSTTFSYLKDKEEFATINPFGFFISEINKEPTATTRDSVFNLYTSSINPEINFNFSSPLYKTHNCNLSYYDNSNSNYDHFIIDFLNESNKNISFDILSNISSSINLDNGNKDKRERDKFHDKIVLSCKDNVYNELSTYTLNLLYNEFDLIFQKPEDLPRHKDNSYLIGKNSEIVIYSSKEDIDNCNIYLNENSSTLSSILIDPPFEVLNVINYTRNITNSTFLNSLGDGPYVGNVTCSTPYEIFEYVNVTKVTSIPELDIISKYKNRGEYHIDDKGEFYAYNDDRDILINVSAPDYDLYNVLTDNVYVEVFNGTNFTNVSAPSIKFININETTYNNATLQIDQSDDLYQGVLVEKGYYEGLFNYTFNITYYDKVNNSNSVIFSYLKDKDNNPSLSLDGHFNLETPNIYTSSYNPNFHISFSPARYRTFNCNVSYDINPNSDYEHIKENFMINESKDASFLLKDINESINIGDGYRDKIEFDCIDNVFGETIGETFYIYFKDFHIEKPNTSIVYNNRTLIGKSSSIEIHSYDERTDNCNIYLNSNLNANLKSLYLIPEITRNGINYARNITNSTFLDNLEQGIYEGNVTCTTPYEMYKNISIEKISHIPELNLSKVYKEEIEGYHIDSNNTFYADYDNENIFVDFSTQNYDLYNVLENNVYVEVFNGTNFTNEGAPDINFININETIFDINGTLEIEQGTENSGLYQGVLVEKGYYEGLFNYTFNITYYDRVDNNNSIIFSYLKDKEQDPYLIFEGDFVLNRNIATTSSYNPNFNISFSPARYRTFNCNISYDDNTTFGYEYFNENYIFNESKNKIFSLKDINENISIGDGREDKIEFDCIDNIYGKEADREYEIKFEKFHIEVPDTELTYDDSILIGKNSFLEIYSKDSRLDNCEVTLTGNQESIKGSFEVDSMEYEMYRGNTYYKNLTNYSILNSLGDGYYDGLIECYTPYYISETFNISKFTSIPKMDLDEIYRDSSDNYYIDSNNFFYADYTDGHIIFNLSTSGYSLEKLLGNEDNFIFEVFDGVTFTSDEDIVPNIEFDNINDSKIKLKISSNDEGEYQGNAILIGEYKGLHNYTFRITYFDKVNNNNSIVLSYLKDKEEHPSMKIIGENLIQEGGTLFLSTNNPTLNIDFSSPLYKTYNCNVTYTDFVTGDEIPYSENDIIKNANSAEINLLDDISSYIQINQDNVDELIFRCTDNSYNIYREHKFNIEYDNSPTVFTSLNIMGSKNKYLSYIPGADLNNVSDKLYFSLKEDKYQKIECFYKAEAENLYICEEEYRNFTGSFYKDDVFSSKQISSDEILFFSGQVGVDPLCKPIEKFDDYVNKDVDEFRHTFTIKGYCENSYGFKTDIKETDFDIIYYSNIVLMGLDFVYENYTAIPIIRLDTDIDDSFTVNISINGINICTFDKDSTREEDEGDHLFRYKGGEECKMNLTIYGGNRVFAKAINNHGTKFDEIDTKLKLDNDNPEIEIEVIDQIDGKVYDQDVVVEIGLFDKTTKIDNYKIEYYIDDIYKNVFENGEVKYNEGDFILKKSDVDEVFLNGEEKGYDLILKFFINETGFNTTYTFRVSASDSVDSSTQKEFSFEVVEGMGIILLDTNNSYVVNSGLTILTKDEDPIINFRTTINATRCSVNTKLIDPISSQEFKGNLKNFPSTPLTEINNYQTINISCIDKKRKVYNFTRNIEYDSSVPNYELEVDSFFFSSGTSEIITRITSKTDAKINCEYSFNNEGDFIAIEEDTYELDFDFEIDETTILVEDFDLVIKCKNKIGVYGLTKTYNFILQDETNFNIGDVKFLNDNNKIEYLLYEDTFYIPSGEILDFSFLSSNSCNQIKLDLYEIDSEVTKIIFDFFNINLGEKIIENGDLKKEFDKYTFEIQNENKIFYLNEYYILNILCDEQIVKEYKINTQDTTFDFEVFRKED